MRTVTKLKIYGVLFVVAAVGLLALWWSVDLRWRPRTITRHQAEIARLLEQSGWVSPGAPGPKLYEIGFRSCPDCVRLHKEEFPRYRKAGVDTRVIEIARKDVNGVSKSTPAERATVAELWTNRSWPLLQQWENTPPDAWTAAGIRPADGDAARTAVVEQGRTLVDDLKTLLGDNGLEHGGFRYPTLVWWDKQGRMRACTCENPATYRFVRHELGA